MSDRDKNAEKNVIDVEPGTLLFIVVLVLLLPLLVMGFLFQ
ncbi:MAG: hypothetical protein SAJ37_23295 [Oscillatoria sp. PMC 1068.18]|nr:hypothetical protein [Oscillatoria sp. PMC 1076.18]MEC4991671.1 hypothetical protein [Oscillatoria sp. PMC 1068.18]